MGVLVQADELWTERRRRDKTAVPYTCHANAVCPDEVSPRAGLARLQADVCRALGWVDTQLSTPAPREPPAPSSASTVVLSRQT